MLMARIAGIVLVLTLLAGALPAAAQGPSPAVTHQGSNIYLVDGTKGEIPNLLPADEVAKIAALQSLPPGTNYIIQSPVSPDDQSVLVGTPAGAGFMSLRDGSSVPFQLPPTLALLSNPFWIDGETLGYYGITVPELQPVLFGVDRRSSEARVVSALPSGIGYPVFTSANGRKVLFASAPVTAAALTASAPGFRTATELPTAPYHLGLQNTPAGSRARALAEFAAMFDPIPAGATINKIFTIAPSLAVVDLVTGETRPVGTIPAGAAPSELSFSQDGSKFAITVEILAPDPDRRLDGSLFSELGYRDVTGNLPPAQNPWLQGNQLITLDFASGAVRTLRAADGDGSLFFGVSWSPDNQTLAVTAQLPARAAGRRYPQYFPDVRAGAYLRLLDAELKEIRRLERIELSDVGLRANFVSPDELIIESHYRLDRSPWYYNLRSGELRKIADRPGNFGGSTGVVATNRSREIVFPFSSYTDPVDFYRMQWDGTAFTRLTWTTEGGRQLSNTAQHPVAFTLRDGTTHSGVLIMPADAAFPPKNVPIIVWQEGGPHSTMMNQFVANVESPFALLPNFGFGLLVVPLYGREGIGPERFDALADNKNFGQIDIDAMNEIVGQLRARGWASKVGVTGCSYGGYFTTQSITRHPTTYDAAHAMCSLVDSFTEWNRGWATDMAALQGLPPQAAAEEYAQDSPAYNAGRIRTPLLAFHGTKDFLPVTVMENFMLQVINNQVPAKLLKFQEAGHGFGMSPGAPTPPQLHGPYELYGAQEQIIWFRTYLMGK
ncbi:MAG: prolyl oligopeptidase family serine peptidase [Chloroflexales bacterium]|nr:prolyl oligopeptidase family serine peptidase [Chloroflexales bacterium]